MRTPVHKIIAGTSLAQPGDSTVDMEVTGGSEQNWILKTDKGTILTGIANGTSGAFSVGDAVTVLFPKSDRNRARIIAKIKRRKRNPTLYVTKG